jgi:2-polyprenyl-3-methyl-5-hydroxy-6-metoxy-1,4-benzoquinol methylase
MRPKRKLVQGQPLGRKNNSVNFLLEYMKNHNTYSKNYFESGVHKIGQYASYEEERFYPAFGEMVKELTRSIHSNKILDIGCAKGYLVDVLRSQGYEAFGTDISEYAINQSPEKIRPYLKVCDLNTDLFPYKDSSFDTIICMGTLEYVENQNHALKEIVRVLKPDGHFFMTTLDHTPEGDEYRKFTKSEAEWNETFSSLGFKTNKKIATRLISRYVKRIIPYDLVKSFSQLKNKTVKFKLAQLLFATPARYAIIEYFYFKQIKSGYLQLCYRKSN